MNTSIKSEGAVRRSDTIQHTCVPTGLSYEAAIRAFEREVGHLDPAVTQRLVERKASWSEIEREIGKIGGTHGLMIIERADLGRVASLSGQQKRCLLYLVGNPVIANRIISIDLRGCFYVPFRVALYDHGSPEGAMVAFDRPSSSLATLGRPEITEIGEDLDRKIDGVVAAVRTR